MTICIPTQSGMSVHCITQWTDFVTTAISECLNVPENSIHVEVKHVGGGFGAKCSRANQIACASALACHLTGVPIRFVMTMQSNMDVIGKRNAMKAEYTIDVDSDGKIVKLSGHTTHDMGISINESPRLLADLSTFNIYNGSAWKLTNELARTDAPSMTTCRAPGTTESIAMAEIMMEHIARVVGKDPVAVRMANLEADTPMKTLLPDFVNGIGKYK